MSRVRCAAFVATSLDGCIARADGTLDWLDGANASVPPGEDCGYAAFIATLDAIVMGRRSFEQVLAFDAWPYGDMPLVVMSRTLAALPPNAPATVSMHAGTPHDVVADAAARGWRSLYVDGGLLVQSFLRAGLLAEITITVVPVLLGAGRPLFGALEHDVALRHAGTRSWPFGFVQSRYEIVGAVPE